MKALVVTQHGGPEVLAVESRPLPEPAPDQVVIAVEAAGVNFADNLMRAGVFPIPAPFVVGTECAGRVSAVGSQVSGLAVGDRVASIDAMGSMAEYVAVAAARVVRVPDEVSSELAAAAAVQGVTAHYLSTSLYPVSAESRVLVHAAAGGVGQCLVQLCKAKGAFVVGSVSTAEKADAVRALGADAVVIHGETDDLASAVRDASGGGVDVVYDGVGRATFDASLASLRRRGVLALFGAASGPVPEFETGRLLMGGSLFLTRPALRDYTASTEELAWRTSEVFAAAASGALKVHVGGRYSLAEATAAYRDLLGRNTTGKLLIFPS